MSDKTPAFLPPFVIWQMSEGGAAPQDPGFFRGSRNYS